MSDREWKSAVGCSIILGVIVIIAAFSAGYWRAWKDFRSIAVKAGVVEYYLDKDHNRQWKFKEVDE